MDPADLFAGVTAVAAGGVAHWTVSRDLGGASMPRLAGWSAPAAVAFVTAGLTGPGWTTGGVLAAVVVVCLAIAAIDARTGLIPDLLVLALCGLALTAPFTPARPAQIAAAAGLAALFLGVRLAYARWRGEEGLGLGDVKLAAAMGALLGAQTALLAVAAAAGGTALWLAARRHAAPDGAAVEVAREAPFGVGLAAATLLGAALRAWGRA